MYVTEYFRHIDQVVSGCPAIISKELLFDGRTKYIGLVNGMLTFGDGSELHFKEFIDTEAGIVKSDLVMHKSKKSTIVNNINNI